MAQDLIIKHVATFSINADDAIKPWNSLNWTKLTRSAGTLDYNTEFKAVWSDDGIYFLISCEDKKLSCSSATQDFDDLYKEDVVEVFLQPNCDIPLYLEYEISPKNKELVLLVPQYNGEFMGWRPWHYENERKIEHRIHYLNRDKNWAAEFFIPFCLMTGLAEIPPQVGTFWRINITRIDYDATEPTLWSLRQMSSKTFHNLKDFGILKFS